MANSIDIPALFKTCAQRVHAKLSVAEVNPTAVNFDYGHYDAVNKNLVSADESITNKDKKYPLIWMITPFEQRFDIRQDYYCELSQLDFLILKNIAPNESIADQTENHFKKNLWPIWEEFKKQLCDSGLFQILSEDAIPFDYVKDWHYQSGVGGNRNLFNDFIAAVQVKGLRLRVNEALPERNQILSTT